MTDLERHEAIDHQAVLDYLGLTNTAATQALLLICQRYSLDPLMKHIVLISGKPYVTRDGYLHVAHQTGQLDGIEVLEEGESDKEWWAKVAVYRKDMAKPFTYRGRYPHDGQQKKYGPEMAVKTAEVMALRRAFDVSGIGAADEQWEDAIEVRSTPVLAAPVEVSPELQSVMDDIDAIPDVEKRQDLLDAISVAIWNETGFPLEDTPAKWIPGVRRMVDKALTPQGLEPPVVVVAGSAPEERPPSSEPAPLHDEDPNGVGPLAAEFPGAVDEETGELLPTGGGPADARRALGSVKSGAKK